MNVMILSNRLVATGAATALAAAALVGVTSTAANATPVTNTYTCELPGLVGPWDISVLSDAPGIEQVTEIPAGFNVPAAFLPSGVTNTFTIPDEAHTALVDFGVENIAFPDFAGSFGNRKIGVTGMTAKVSEMTDNGNDTFSFQSDGANAAFEVPAAGVRPVLSPKAFSLVASTTGFGDQTVPCVLKAGTTAGAYATIAVVKNEATAAGKAVARTLKTTKASKLNVTVGAPNQVPTGKVVVKEGRKVLGSAKLRRGKATVNLGKLTRGRHNVKVFYNGDGYTMKDTSDKIVFTVKKP